MRISKDQFVPGVIVHLYNHAVADMDLFEFDDDYELFLGKFRQFRKNVPVDIIAYCLMPNHFHFVIRQNSEKAIYRLFNSVLSSYVQIFNHASGRKGTLLMSSLNHKLVDSRGYFTKLILYLHANPVKAGFVEDPIDWCYSDYAAWIGEEKGLFFENEFLMELFGSGENYARTMKAYLKAMQAEPSIHDINAPGGVSIPAEFLW